MAPRPSCRSFVYASIPLWVAHTPAHTRPLSAGLALPSVAQPEWRLHKEEGHVSTTLLQRPQGEAGSQSRLSLSYLLERPTLSHSLSGTRSRVHAVLRWQTAASHRDRARSCVGACVLACVRAPLRRRPRWRPQAIR